MYKQFIILILTIILTCSFCFYKRNSIDWISFDESFDYNEHHYNDAIEILNNSYSGIYSSYHDIETIEDLQNKSDVIAIVELKDRKQIYNNIESCINIIDILKGDIQDSELIIIEAGCIFDGRVINQGFLPLLKENEKYLVFLQDTNGLHKYNYVDESYSMYLLKDDYKIKYINYDSDISLSYNDIIDYDYYVIDYSQAIQEDIYTKEQVDVYNQTIKKYFDFYKELTKK